MPVPSFYSKHTWHPCMILKDFETQTPLPIVRSDGAFLELASGQRVIDGISSWWCKPLGHQHPRLRQALVAQANHYEQVIMANTVFAPVSELSELLIAMLPGYHKVFYASDGSCAVEAALKMSLHTRFIQNQTQKNKILSLSNGYHGETMLALSVSDIGLYQQPYQPWLQPVEKISPIPYVHGASDPLWSDCSNIWPEVENFIVQRQQQLTAIIVEPIVQGAGQMKIYSADFLKRLAQLCQQLDIHVVADEIMTGFLRTGTWLASDHAGIKPDFICLSKALTGGWLPMSAVLIPEKITQFFEQTDDASKSFLHSHTYGGNPLAAAVAVACLKTLKEENIADKVPALQQHMFNTMNKIVSNTDFLINLRSIGGIIAADLNPEIFHSFKRPGFQFYCHALKHGALLRPLGNTIYWLPPLNVSLDVITQLGQITQAALVDLVEQR